MSLFFGTRGAAQLLQAVPDAATDASTPVALRVRSNRLMPGGALFEEAVVSRVVLALAYQAVAAALTCRVYVDDGLRFERTVALPAQPVFASRSVVVPVSAPLVVDGVTLGRLALRGTWYQVEVETTAPVALDGAELVWVGARRR